MKRLKRPGRRPETLAEAAELARSGAAEFGMGLAEFLDEAKKMGPEGLRAALAEQPCLLGPGPGGALFWRDAYLAAVAEHLSRNAGVDPPAWSEDPERFLSENWFDNGGLASLNSLLLAQSPVSFRRRRIFAEADPLRRA